MFSVKQKAKSRQKVVNPPPSPTLTVLFVAPTVARNANLSADCRRAAPPVSEEDRKEDVFGENRFLEPKKVCLTRIALHSVTRLSASTLALFYMIHYGLFCIKPSSNILRPNNSRKIKNLINFLISESFFGKRAPRVASDVLFLAPLGADFCRTRR